MKSDEKIRKKIEKEIFTQNSFIETQIWMYSSFSAISLAFFFSQFGANESTLKDTFTNIAIYSYSISLISNAFISFIFSILRNDGDLIHKLNLNQKFNCITILSWISFIISILLTIGIYSIKAMILTIFIGIALYFVFEQVKKDIDKQEKLEHELEMEKMRNGEFD